MKKILIFLFVMVCAGMASAQPHWNKVYSYNDYLGLQADSVLIPPQDTLRSAANGSLAIKNGHVYQKNGAWTQVDGGGNAVQSLTGSQSIQYGPFNSMPSPGTAGRFYAATDSSRWYFDNGVAWLNLSGSGGGTSGAILTFGTGFVAGTYNGSIPVNIIVDTNFMSTRAWRQKGLDSLAAANASLYKLKADSAATNPAAFTTQASRQKLSDSLQAITNAALVLKKNLNDSIPNNPAAFTTQASRQKLSDSLQALIALKVTNSGGAKILGSGNTASMPAASAGPGLYYNTDSNFFQYSNGSTWSSVTSTIYGRQGVSASGGDSLVLGGAAGAFSRADTIYINGFPFYWTGLAGQATPAGTDSAIIKTANQQLKAVPISAIKGPNVTAGAYLSRPAASNCQCYYFSTDSAIWSYDNGAWVDVRAGSGSGSVAPYIIPVTAFGAVADCNGTSGNGTNNTTAFRNAIAAANLFGFKIYVPPATTGTRNLGYRITDSLLFSGKNGELYGAGQGQFTYYQLSDTPSLYPSVIYMDNGTADGLVFDRTTTNVYPVMNVHDLSIVNIASSRPTAGAGIVIKNNNQESNFKNLNVVRFFNGINQQSANLVTYDHINVLFPVDTGMLIRDDVVGTTDFGGIFVHHVNIVSDTFATGSTTTVGMYVSNPSALEVQFCSVSGLVNKPNGAFWYAIKIDARDGPTSDIRIANSWFEGIQKTAIYIHNLSGGNVGNVIIPDNEIESYNTNATTYPAIDLSNLYNVQLHGLILGGQSQPTGFALRLDSINNLSIAMPMNVTGYGSLAYITNSTFQQNDIFGNVINHGAVTDSTTLSVIGTSTFKGAATFNSTFIVQPATYTLTGYQGNISGMYLQGAAANNQIFADNANYNSGWTRPASGFTEGVNMYNGQFAIFTNNTGTGAFTPNVSLKTDYNDNGSVYLGGNASLSVGSTSGSTVVVGTSKIWINPTPLAGGLITDSPLVYHAADNTMRAAAPFGGGVPGSNTQIIYNNSGAFGATSNLGFDASRNLFYVDTAVYSLTNAQARISDIWIGGAAANNMNLFDNMKYASGWTKPNAGYSEGFNFYNGQVAFSSNPSTSAGSLTPQWVMKTDDLGFVAMGGKSISLTHGSYTGATMWVSPDSIMFTKPGTGTSAMPLLVWNTSTDRVDTVSQGGVGGGSSGIYVPTVTGINFVTSVTADSATWSRSGNVVTVYGSMTVTASANNSQVNISVTLPVASLLNGGHACWGGGWTAVGNGTGITVTTYSTNHIAELSYASGAAASGIPIVLQYSFQYQIQ